MSIVSTLNLYLQGKGKQEKESQPTKKSSKTINFTIENLANINAKRNKTKQKVHEREN